jgi:putative copper export protein
MGTAFKTWLRAINDKLHDLAAGAWPGAVFALWMVRRGAVAALGAQPASDLARTWSWVLTVMLVALVVQVATGGARLFYWKVPIAPELVQSKGRVAAAKHVVFVLAFVGAAIVAFSLLQ